MDRIKAFYKFKRNKREYVKEHITFTELADKVGIGRCFMSEIINGRKTTKVVAYSIVKGISPTLEIEDLFDVEE